MPLEATAGSKVGAVRAFSRFYTRQIGILRDGLLESPFSLTEVRVLYELANCDRPTASQVGKVLGLDRGYMSRILGKFLNAGLIRSKQSKADRRQIFLSLSPKGSKLFRSLDRRSSEQVAAMLGRLPTLEQNRLVQSMRSIEAVLGDRPEPKTPYVLRPHQPGDMGWVVYRHGVLYSQEHGYDEHFEALVAEIVAKFIQNFEPKRERCWIAEREAENVGSIFLVKHSDEVAKLRLLLVDPAARGLGIGKRLVSECVRFARLVGYKRLILWTQSDLLPARRLYEAAGFRLIKEEPHHSWGRDLVAETWELTF